MANWTALGVTLVSVGIFKDVAQYPNYLTLYVTGPPVFRECGLMPADPSAPKIMLESKFNFICTSPSAEVGPIKYSVFCKMSETTFFVLYSDSYPEAKDIIIPVMTCHVLVKMENFRGMESTKIIGKIFLKSPGDVAVSNDIDQASNDTLTDIEAQVQNIDSGAADDEESALKKTLVISTQAKRLDKLLENDTNPKVQEWSSEILVSLSEHLLNITDAPSTPLLEVYFQNSSKNILEVLEDLRQLQEENIIEGGDYNPAIIEELQTAISTVTEAVMKRTDVGETAGISTTTIEMKVLKAESSDTVGKKIHLKDMELELPEGVGNGTISLSAVSTTLNPMPEAFLKHATNFINVSLEGSGVEDQDFPLIYSFPRNTKVSDSENSPNVVKFDLSGKAHCVRYDSVKKQYGWRVISNTAKMSMEIPPGGRALITVNINASTLIMEDVHTVNLLINDKSVGKLCWPLVDDVSFSNIKITRSISDKNKDELWVENARNVKTRVGLGFQISYSKKLGFTPPKNCTAVVARKGKLTYPVNTFVKLLQLLGQCLVYDESLKEFVNDERCTAYPEKDFIRCECTGASVRTSVDAPVTNNIDFSEISFDLLENPVPFIFSMTTSCIFLLLCFIGTVQDIRSKRKLAPIMDSRKVKQPIKYNVFIYISKFRHPRGKRNTKFSVTLRGRTGVSVTNTYINPGVSHGAMLHLIHHSDQLLGSIRKVVLTPQHKSTKWHVSRVVVSDAVEQEVAVFLFNCWVAEAKSRSRISEVERNRWRENFFAKVMSDIVEGIPVLMLFLAGSVQVRKLDNMLIYALGLMIWALIQLWFYEAEHPLYRPDDCIQSSASTSQAAVNSLVRLILNFLLLTMSSILIGGTISVSLMYKEKKSTESRSFRAKGFLPLPHWVRLVVRGFATLVMVTTVSFITIMSYMFSKIEFNAWLVSMGEAFAFQIASKCLQKLLICATRYLLYLPDPDKFNEEMMNSEGMRVMCPVCHVCPKVLHSHFKSHLSLTDIHRPRHWFIDTSSSSLFKDKYIFPV